METATARPPTPGPDLSALSPDQVERVERLHRDTLIVDALTTSVLDREYLAVLRAAGVDATNYTVADTSLVHGQVLQDDFETACRKIAMWLRRLAEMKDVAGLATTVAEVDALKAQGRFAEALGYELYHILVHGLDVVAHRVFHSRGAYGVSPVYEGGPAEASAVRDLQGREGPVLVYSVGKVGKLGDRGSKVPTVRHEAPETKGSLDKEIIRRVVRRNESQVRFCYEQGLHSNPDLKGRVEIKFIIAPTGAVQNSVVSKTEVGNQVAQCIANAVRRWTFPSPEGGGIVSVTYPWTFSAGN